MAGDILLKALLVSLLWIVTAKSQGPSPFIPMSSNITCEERNSCVSRGEKYLTFKEINCFCDDECSRYDDCCADHVGTSLDTQISPSSMKCVYRADILEANDIYMVSACPKNYNNHHVEELCESVVASDPFLDLPVTGLRSKLLFKNYFCALCSGETTISFWEIEVECDNKQFVRVSQNVSNKTLILMELLERTRMDYQCRTFFKHSSSVPRPCKSVVSSCARDWGDKSVRRGCRGPSSYTYVKDLFKSFRNVHCAQCNHITDPERLGCVDSLTLDPPVFPGDFFNYDKPFQMKVNLDSGKSELKGLTADRDIPDMTFNLRACAQGHVFNPFSAVCRQVGCSDGYELQKDNCVLVSTLSNARTEKSERQDIQTQPTTERQTNSNTNATTIATTTSPVITFTRPTAVVLKPVVVATAPRITSTTPPPVLHPDDRWWTGDEVAPRMDSNDMVILRGSTTDLPPSNPTTDCPLLDTNQKSACVTPQETQSSISTVTAAPAAERHVEMFAFHRKQSFICFIALVISMVALLVLIVMVIAVSSLRNVVGKCALSLALTVLVSQLVLLIATNYTANAVLCVSSAIILHYTVLATFAWLAVIAIHFFRGFHSAGTKGCYVYAVYCLGAWIIPACIVAASVVLHFFKTPQNLTFLKPNYNVGPVCWLNGWSPILYTFALPLAVFATLIVLFVLLAIYRCLHNKSKDSIRRHTKTKQRLRFLLFTILCIVVICTWTAALIAAYTDYSFLWYVFIALTALQGPLLAVTFVSTARGLCQQDRNGDRDTKNQLLIYSANGASYPNRSASGGSVEMISQVTSI